MSAASSGRSRKSSAIWTGWITRPMLPSRVQCRPSVRRWLGARAARGPGARRVPPRARRRPAVASVDGRRDLGAEDVRPAAAGARRAARSTRRRGTASSSTSTCGGAAPRLPPGARRLAALVRRSCRRPSAAGQVADRAAGAPRRRLRASTSPRRAPRSRSPSTSCATRPRCRASRGSGPTRWRADFSLDDFAGILAGRRTQVKGLLRDQSVVRRRRQRLLRRDPARRADVAVRAGRQARRPTTSSACTPRCATRSPMRSPRPPGKPARRAQGRQARGHAGARPHGPDLPGLRRHRARGVVRRLLAPVLPDLPDRRQAARRPAAVPPAEVSAGLPRRHPRCRMPLRDWTR